MREVTVKLFQFDELSDKAKEKARNWWRQCEAESFSSDGELTESAETAAKLLGIDLKTRPVPLHGGGTRYEPYIWWQLHVQGSGASFEGSYSYRKGSVKAIKAEFGDAEIQRIAQGLADLQKKHFYRLTASIKADSRFVHSGGMTIENDDASGETIGELRELLRDFADWIYKGIDAEYSSRMEDEYIDESIRANEYDFREDGKRSDG